MENYKIYTNDNKRIKGLIVDDSKFVHVMLSKVFKKLDIDIVGTAFDGIEALELFKKSNPDFVTLDITMPRLNGLRTLVEMKKLNPNIKVVMISSFGPEKILKECIFRGALSFIQKPFSEEEAVKKIHSILKKSYEKDKV